MRKSTKLGAIISPLVPPAIWIIYFLISPNPDYEKNGSFEMSFAIFSIVIISWYVISFMLGTIIFKLLKKIKKLTFIRLVFISTFLSSGVFGIFEFLLIKSGEHLIWKDIAFIHVVGALFGFITSSVFCVLSGITRRSVGKSQSGAH